MSPPCYKNPRFPEHQVSKQFTCLSSSRPQKLQPRFHRKRILWLCTRSETFGYSLVRFWAALCRCFSVPHSPGVSRLTFLPSCFAFLGSAALASDVWDR